MKNPHAQAMAKRPRGAWGDYTTEYREAYSYDRPAYLFWSAFTNGLIDAGFTEKQAKEWILSKRSRWALDGELSDLIENVAYEFARKQDQP